MRTVWFHSFLFAISAMLIGCGSKDTSLDTSLDTSATTATPDSRYVVTTEPAGAIPVGEARTSTEDDQDITLVGIIGGSTEPFVDGLAAFTIVDPKVPYCAPEEGCPTPWDYCCTQDQVRENIATIKVVDESGSPIEGDARTLLGVEELSMIVVQGKAQRDEQGNLSIAANSVYVRSGE